MNQTYRLVWSLTQQAWVVAGELAKANKKSSLKTCSMALLLAGAACGGQAIAGPALNTLPTGETVVSGRATFDRSVDKQLTINQATNKLITNWSSFDIGSAARVSFVQPNTNSIALNRITSGSPTEVFGQVTANGRLVLVNPNGIAFGGRSQVSANALIASVLDIQDSNFNTSTLLFKRGNATGSIENRGKLTTTAGSVSLLAPTVKNTGSIMVTRGDANLINADAVQLSSFNPPAITASTVAGLIQQSGKISAMQVSGVGGKILLTGDKSKVNSQVQLAGTLQSTQTQVDGRSILINGNLNLNGAGNKLDLTSTDGYSLSNTAAVNLNGAASGFSVNGTAYTVIRDVNQLQAMNKKLDGKYVLANNIDASATASWNNGAGFKPIGNDTGSFKGVLDGLGHYVDGLTINRPTTNNVGLVRDAFRAKLQNIGLINTQIEGQDYTGGLGGQLTQSSIINSYVTGSILGVNYVGGVIGSAFKVGISKTHSTANVEGDSSVGGLVGYNDDYSAIESSYATGKITGADAIGGLVGSSAYSSIKLSYATGEVSGLSSVGGLVGKHDFSSTVSDSFATGKVYGWEGVGGLVGYNDNTSVIKESYATGNVSGNSELGGLVGVNSNASIIEDSYATGNVTGRDRVIGGLVGYGFKSTVTRSYATGNVAGVLMVGGLLGYGLNNSLIDASYATGDATGDYDVGGLVGYHNYFSRIENSYATGNVVSSSYYAGGLVGFNAGSSIKTSYAAGKVTGKWIVGGLVGQNQSSLDRRNTLIQNSYWDVQASGQSSGVGSNTGTLTRLVGLNSTQMKNLDSFANWGSSIDAQGGTDSVWRIYEGQSTPLLRSFLKPVDVVINNQTKTYDGQAFSGGSYSLSDPAAILQGSLSYGGNAQGARNAGSYTITGSGLYSGQQGYDIRMVNGSLTIQPKKLTITAVPDSKVYDGTGIPALTGGIAGDSPGLY